MAQENNFVCEFPYMLESILIVIVTMQICLQFNELDVIYVLILLPQDNNMP